VSGGVLGVCFLFFSGVFRLERRLCVGVRVSFLGARRDFRGVPFFGPLGFGVFFG